MILAWILSFLSDFAVSGLVGSIDVPGRCSFGNGVVSPLPSNTSSSRTVPNNQDGTFDIIKQALATSARNGGEMGILSKANADTKFRADATDILGGWSCKWDGQPAAIFAFDVGLDVPLGSLIKSGRLFNNSHACGYTTPKGGSGQAQMHWSMSGNDDDGKVWDVKFAINTGKSPDAPLNMLSYQCSMSASSVEWKVRRIVPSTTLDYWCHRTAGDVYNPFSNEPPENTVAMTLNTMVTAAFTEVQSLPDSDQGCLVTKTQIPWFVCALLLLVAILFVTLLSLCVGYFGYLSTSEKRRPDADRWAAAYTTPQGLEGWMGQAVREHDAPANAVSYSTMIDPKEFRRWQFGLNKGGDGMLYGLHMDENSVESRAPLLRQEKWVG